MEFNRKRKFIKILIFIVLLSSCKKIPNQIEQSKLEIWENIQKAVKNNDLDYLLKISYDTLYCIECNNGKSVIKKERFFKYHFEQMLISNNKSYSYYVEKINNIDGFNKRYRVNYKTKKGNTIYTLIEGNNKVKFQGVFSIP